MPEVVEHMMNLILPLILPSAIGISMANASEPSLVVELDTVQPSEKGCRMTFVVQNGLEQGLAHAAFELVLFNRDGKVTPIAAVGFKDLPVGKTRAMRFDLARVDCAAPGRVLLNDATRCSGPELEPSACMLHLKPSMRTDIVFGV